MHRVELIYKNFEFPFLIRHVNHLHDRFLKNKRNNQIKKTIPILTSPSSSTCKISQHSNVSGPNIDDTRFQFTFNVIWAVGMQFLMNCQAWGNKWTWNGMWTRDLGCFEKGLTAVWHTRRLQCFWYASTVKSGSDRTHNNKLIESTSVWICYVKMDLNVSLIKSVKSDFYFKRRNA